MVVPQDSHNAQAQAGSVAAHQIRGFEKQLSLNHTQFIQQLAERMKVRDEKRPLMSFITLLPVRNLICQAGSPSCWSCLSIERSCYHVPYCPLLHK